MYLSVSLLDSNVSAASVDLIHLAGNIGSVRAGQKRNQCGTFRRRSVSLCIRQRRFRIAGILVNALWINCPKWFSSLVYIAMGWICVLAFRQIVLALPKSAFLWLLTGGLIYTAGGIIYALKLPIFNATHKNFGSHEIFHLFVMGGSLCHYVMMYAFVA